MSEARVIIGLSAVIVAITEDAPYVVVTKDGGDAAGLPFGPFDPAGDRTLELSLRGWVKEQTGFNIGYAEQLYTFGDRGREMPIAESAGSERVISISYLALTPSRAVLDRAAARWRSWYDFFPWEDWRGGRPGVIDEIIAPRLKDWAQATKDAESVSQRRARVRLAFALDGAVWNEERSLERYELLYEAGLAPEAERDRARFDGKPAVTMQSEAGLGEPMASDHRRILATAIGRLRAKIKYRPVVFELAPAQFTLLHLQRVVEAIAGLELHKQNFRRLLDRTGLVEGTGQVDTSAGGRPAELFRARLDTLNERPVGGVHVPAPRGE
ncbi:NUDIX hydrolase [Candidatus Viadribacter manganicus]|uniref:NAD regulator n=1 Tax=Candidatus Viadribacter manganicus TaxID=1759059 RepID=A0A1B1ALH9_9PROT|nr:NAD regulator [Candidatus Viadribacter manganicus]ANP47395.1 NAD regulator [Candidatus Viadribacter manganicus]